MHSLPSLAAGFTLIEAGVVLAIGAILAASAAPAMQALIATRRLDNAAALLAADIGFARSTAAARNESVRLSFLPRAGGSCYVIHTGGAGACTCRESGPALCRDGARELRTVSIADTDQLSLSTNVKSIVFDPVHGTSTPTGTLRLIGANQREVRHIVNIMGRVRSCTPTAGVAGYRAC